MKTNVLLPCILTPKITAFCNTAEGQGRPVGLAVLYSEDLDHGLRHLDFALPTLFLTASLIGYFWRCGRR